MTHHLTGRPFARPVGAPATAPALAGAGAALLGLACTGVPVLVCWLFSAPPGDTPADAARLAGALWLLAHGGPLVRAPGGAPLTVTPLALTALCVLLLARAGARTAVPGAPGRAGAPCGALCAGYLAVALPVALGCRGAGVLRSQPLPDLLAVAVLGWAGAALGARTGPRWWPPARRRLVARLGLAVDAPRWWQRPPLPPGVLGPATGAGLLVLVAGGALLVGADAVLRGDATEAAVRQVAGGSWAGELELLLCCLLVLPNAVLWSVGYALGPGFRLGTGTLVAPGRAQLGALPDFPLLALVPGSGTGWQFAVLAVPLLAAVLVAVLLGHAAAGPPEAEPWSAAATARTAAAVAGAVAAAVTAGAWLAGGALGQGRMARLGPVLLCGPVAGGWFLLAALPVALGLRWYLLRGRRPDPGPPVEQEPAER
ncbi:DUF6350 family protein [Kitasatospora sp. NPDC006697]|uniref:cell division protein PerM n=1 Tax=Kitasatospora sp. NPDC006697 TaxID=3364020 RepID=UPI0036AA7CD2